MGSKGNSKGLYIFFYLSFEVALFSNIIFFCCQDKIDNDIKEDFKVLPNQNCQEKIIDNAFKYENMKEVDRQDRIIIENSNLQVSNTIKDSTQDLNKLDFSAKYSTEDVPKKIPSITKASPVKLFAENTDVDKVTVFKFSVLLKLFIELIVESIVYILKLDD